MTTEIVWSNEEVRQLLSDEFNGGKLMPRSRYNRWKRAALVSRCKLFGYRELAKLKFVGEQLPRFKRLATVKDLLVKELENNEDAFNPPRES